MFPFRLAKTTHELSAVILHSFSSWLPDYDVCATSRHHATCTLDVSMFMPMFWVTQHPTITHTPVRSPPSSYPLADTIIYSIFIMWLSIIPASCKWLHHSCVVSLYHMEGFEISSSSSSCTLCFTVLCNLCTTANHWQTIWIEPVSPMCKKKYNIPERREDLNPGCVQQRCQPMTWIWRMHNSCTWRTSMPLTIDYRTHLWQWQCVDCVLEH